MHPALLDAYKQVPLVTHLVPSVVQVLNAALQRRSVVYGKSSHILVLHLVLFNVQPAKWVLQSSTVAALSGALSHVRV
jgi:hypothetical protein